MPGTTSWPRTAARSSRSRSSKSSPRRYAISSRAEPPAPLVVVFFGPTASGKTAFLDRAYDGTFEVVVADSMQAYRGFDIGTAKPSRTTLERIPHHLIDILDPEEQYTCGEFVRRADEAVRDILRRGRLPVLSGGTAYYIRSFVYGLPDSPPAAPAVRKQIEAEEREKGLPKLYDELCAQDPAAGAAIHPNDRYRIVRALEIARVTGRPRSEIRLPDSPRPTWTFRLVGLRVERETLARRIAARVEEMFALGLVAEVKGLFSRGLSAASPAMRGIGYQELCEMRRGCLTISDVRRLIVANTVRFAKRQMTFFRSMVGVTWTEAEEALGMSALRGGS